MAQAYALAQIARKQRQFILASGAIYIVNIAMRSAIEVMARTADPAVVLVAAMLSMAVSLTILVIAIVLMVQLMAALNYGIPMRIIFGFLMIIPLINLLVLLAINGRATKTLQNAGVKVGLLGASNEGIAELNACGAPALGFESPDR